jgi:hypothetical protein
MKRRVSKKKRTVIALLIVLAVVSVGYAVVMTNLKLIGYTTVNKNSVSVTFSNAVVNTEGITDVTPTIGKEGNDPNNTKITFNNITLNNMGDFYEFTVDMTNDGTVDAMITGFTKATTPANLPPYVKFTMTYDDDVALANNQILKKGDTETLKIRVEYDAAGMTNEAMEAMTTDQSVSFAATITYGQATSSAVARARHIKSCPGCQFAYYTSYQVHYGDMDEYGNTQTPDKLEDYASVYSDDYTQLKDSNDKQRNTFLGHILDGEGRIQRAFACGIYDGKAYCLEGISEYYKDTERANAIGNKNRSELERVFDINNDCEDNTYSGDNMPSISCQAQPNNKEFSAYIGNYGGVNTHDYYEYNDSYYYNTCYVESSGYMHCEDY